MVARARRSDAVLNRERLLAAARAVLAELNGADEDLALHVVAKRAGVGQGTLYRHFPTREQLLAEVYRLEIDELVAAVPDLLAELMPLEALARWLDRLVEYARVKRGVMVAIEASAWHGLYADNSSKLDDALTALLTRGQAAMEIREGVDAADVILLLGALSRVPASEWDTRARTVVAIVVDGLRRR